MSGELVAVVVLVALAYLAVLVLTLAVLTAAKRGDEAQLRDVRALTDPETGEEPAARAAGEGVEERRRAS